MRYLEEKLKYTNSKGESVEISHSSLFFLNKVDGLGAVKNIINVQKSPFQDGVTPTGESLDTRNITIEGSITITDKEELLKHKRKLYKVFNPKLQGNLRYELGDFKKEINCKVEFAPDFPAVDSKFKKFLIQLFCPSPFWRDIQENKNEIAVWLGDFEFPLEVSQEGIEMGHREPSLITNIFNPGDVTCGMRIEFKALATVNTPSLFNVNTREYIKINKTMAAGERIVITTHTGQKRVEKELNGVLGNAFNWWDDGSTFMQLDVGDNLLRYNAEKNVDNLEVNIYYTPQYLGV